jgi:choline kinase/phosphatidylglycerophosphate synthase
MRTVATTCNAGVESNPQQTRATIADRRPFQAIILAAGRGSRLANGAESPPKPLARVGGITLLERTLLTLKKAGVTEFVVVTGHRGKEIRDSIEFSRPNLPITWVTNPQWEKQNGVSVLAAECYAQERFLLTMADHVFFPETVRRLREARLFDGEALLAIDRKIAACPDLDDATKVLLHENRIKAIGKNLTAFDAIDTGIFLCSGALFEALRKSAKAGDCTLSDGIRALADAGRMRAFDICGEEWLDVDTPAMHGLAETLLYRRLTKPQDGPFSRWLNRPISLRVTRWLAETPITPNQITLALLVLGLLAAVLFATGGYWPMLMAAVLFHAQSVLDGCDGEIARLKFMESRWGGVLDVVCDGVVTSAGFFGIGIGLARQLGESGYAFLGVACALAALGCTSMLFVLAKRSGRFSGSYQSMSPFTENSGTSPQPSMGRLTRVLDGLSRRDYTYLVLALAIVGKLTWFLWATAIGIGLYLAGLLVLYVASFRHERVQSEHPTANPSKPGY